MGLRKETESPMSRGGLAGRCYRGGLAGRCYLFFYFFELFRNQTLQPIKITYYPLCPSLHHLLRYELQPV